MIMQTSELALRDSSDETVFELSWRRIRVERASHFRRLFPSERGDCSCHVKLQENYENVKRRLTKWIAGEMRRGFGTLWYEYITAQHIYHINSRE